MSNAHILVIDDEPDIRMLVQEILEDEHYQVSTAEDGASARQALESNRPELILLDIWMPDTDGITLLKEWADSGQLPCPVVMMSGHGSVETAVEATRLGAYDFLEKPLSLAKLLLTVERALETQRLQKENIGLRQQTARPPEPLGKSPLMQDLRAQAQRMAAHDAWVLLRGEAGSGKTTFARYMHDQSHRSQGPFLEVSVASIARENSTRELFGSMEDGQVQQGRLEQANGGTLFLTDIGDMDMETQARLLSAVESGTFMRIGGTKPININIRVFAASHQNLEQAVEEGRFREDLYHRLNVLPLQIPPLRDHVEDVPELLAFYSDILATRDKLGYRRFSTGAQNQLRNYDWPGNVLELKNLVQRLLILSSSEEINTESVIAAQGAPLKRPADDGSLSESWLALPLREAREQFEQHYMEDNLMRLDGKVGDLAKHAGMERTNLYRKLKGLGIEIK